MSDGTGEPASSADNGERMRDLPDPAVSRPIAADEEWEDPREADIVVFAGPRADSYLATYRELRGGGFSFRNQWSWGAFVFQSLWLFYRRQYIVGALLVWAVVVVVMFLPQAVDPITVIGFHFAFGIVGRRFYVRTAVKTIARASEQGLTGERREAFLKRAGGVSWWAPLVVTVLVIVWIAAPMV